jgi:hypothetical protein
MSGLWPDRELAGSCVCRGARPASGTRATGGAVKPDADDRIARHIVSGPPVDTGMSLESVRLLGVPIQDKGPQVMPLFSLMLTAIGAKGGPPNRPETGVVR